MALFRKATVASRTFKILLAGPAGAGKTYTALRMATALGGPIALIDSEHGSSEIYAGDFDFDVLVLDSYHPQIYMAAIDAAVEEGYGTLIIDGLSHAWFGPDGVLNLVDAVAGKYAGNRFAAWSEVSPLHRDLMEKILATPIHVVATVRTKTRYEVEVDPQRGAVPRRIGTAPVQREGIDYEFDVVGYLDPEKHTLHVQKTRFSVLNGRTFTEPGENVIRLLQEWIQEAAQAPAPQGPPRELQELKKRLSITGPTKPVEVEDARAYWALVRKKGIPRAEAHRVLRDRGVQAALAFAEAWNGEEEEPETALDAEDGDVPY